MKRLPLSWCSKEIKSPKFHSVDLPLSGLSWISTAEIPLHYTMDNLYCDLVSDFPGFVIRGVSAGSASYLKDKGADLIRTGAEAVVDLNNPEGLKRSVLELARRGGRNGCVHEIPYSEFYVNKVSSFALDSTHAQEPKLSYLFRTGFDQSTRCFVLATEQDHWLGAITISHQDESCAHTETILRRKNAPAGVMEALFVSVMSTLKDQGYTHLSLGEVPFITGYASRTDPELSGTYAKEFVFRSKHLLKHSFDYKGLYCFKNKFSPEWKPVYLAAKPGISWRLLMDLYIQSRFIDLSLFKLINNLKKLSPNLLKTG
jgi:glycosyltransferase 2 family protein